jgi:NADH:ubiquinone reductase (H+-translocating)
MKTKPHIVIIGGGFGGLNAACNLGKKGFPVTLIDKQNYHLFQPLLYQVATGFLTPGDIASPLRSVLARHKSVRVIMDEVTNISSSDNTVITTKNSYTYDQLIIAAGASTSYFGNDTWAKNSTGLKTIDDSLTLRSQILTAFEEAERSDIEKERERLLTFVIVGAGPTGVELAGALSELSKATLKNEFRSFDPSACRIILFEGADRILPTFSPKISKYTEKILVKLGVEVQTNTFVKNIEEGFIEVEKEGSRVRINAGLVTWAAGVKAAPISLAIKNTLNLAPDKSGRIKVAKDLSIPEHPEIFVIGDLAYLENKYGKPLPGLAPVAMQQGKYLAKLIYNRTLGRSTKPFSYFDKGNMAVIGKGRAVAEIGRVSITGLPAWVSWAIIHIYFLIEFENKFIVFLRWIWNYITNKRGSRLITKH